MAKQLPADVRRIAVVVIVGAVMSILDTTIVNVALQTLRDDLGTSLSTIQWVSTGYLLALASAIPLTGWAAERFGPRRVWMTVVTAFVATSALCGAAWSAESLIAFRVLQGAFGAILVPGSLAILTQTFEGPARQRDDARHREQVAGADPLDRRQRRVEIVDQRVRRDVRHRDVELHHDRAEHDDAGELE